MCRALCRERIDPGHCVSRLENTENKVQRHGIEGITRVEVIAVEPQSGGEDQRIWNFEYFLVGQVQEVFAGGNLDFEFTQAEFEDALYQAAIRMRDYRVHPGDGLGGFGCA